jgi:hypothetical protein
MKRPREPEAALGEVEVEVTTGDGFIMNHTHSPTDTVLTVKREVEHEIGIRPQDACCFSHDLTREESQLKDGEELGGLRVGNSLKVKMSLLVDKADAQQLVPEISVEMATPLDDDIKEDDDGQRYIHCGVAFVPDHRDWLITTEQDGYRIKIFNIQTGSVICTFGEFGDGDGQFNRPMGLSVTSTSFVAVADSVNNRVQILRLVVGEDSSKPRLEFVRVIGNGTGSKEGQFASLTDITTIQHNGRDTILVTELDNHRISQFALDGTFIKIFAGTGQSGSGDGELKYPTGITTLGTSGDVAVSDCANYRVQIFDSEGKYKLQFGTKGKEDAQLDLPAGVTSDVYGNVIVMDETNRLQIFSPEGKHLCTRNDLGLHTETSKGVAWHVDGGLAIANDQDSKLLLWRPGCTTAGAVLPREL